MNDPTDNLQPRAGHPAWCAMDIDGRHVGELELAAQLKGYNIYTRPIDFGAGGVGLEVIVATPQGQHTRRVEIEPGMVTEAATLAEFNRLLAGIDDGPSDENR